MPETLRALLASVATSSTRDRAITILNQHNFVKYFDEFYSDSDLLIDYLEEDCIIFLDEIQVSERAITSLKYFAESLKPYKIVTAGSLLGVKINRFKSSFPVGKVNIKYL